MGKQCDLSGCEVIINYQVLCELSLQDSSRGDNNSRIAVCACYDPHSRIDTWRDFGHGTILS